MGTTIGRWNGYKPIIAEDIRKASTLVRLLLMFQKPKKFTHIVEDTKKSRVTVTNYYKTFNKKIYYYTSYCTIERRTHNAKNK